MTLPQGVPVQPLEQVVLVKLPLITPFVHVRVWLTDAQDAAGEELEYAVEENPLATSPQMVPAQPSAQVAFVWVPDRTPSLQVRVSLKDAQLLLGRGLLCA